MTPNRRPRCSLPTPLGIRSSTTSPLCTQQLHELSNFQHLLSVVFVRLECGHLLAECFAPSHLLGASHQGSSDRLGARKARRLQLGKRPLRFVIEPNRNGDRHAPNVSRFVIQFQSLHLSIGRRISGIYYESVDIRIQTFGRSCVSTNAATSYYGRRARMNAFATVPSYSSRARSWSKPSGSVIEVARRFTVSRPCTRVGKTSASVKPAPASLSW